MNNLADFFLHPRRPQRRRYETLRAICIDGLTPAQAAHQFAYSPGTVRDFLADFRKHPDRSFFALTSPGPQPADPAAAPATVTGASSIYASSSSPCSTSPPC